MNLVDLSSRTESGVPMTEDSSQPLLEGREPQAQSLNSEPFLCGLPLNSFDRFDLRFEIKRRFTD